jgi:hypothetical protein
MATVTHTSTLADLLHLDDLGVEEQAAFLDEVGGLIMESAIVRFLADAPEPVQEAFAEYVAAHGDEEQFLQNVLQVFPEFTTVMAEEIQAFETDMRRVLG